MGIFLGAYGVHHFIMGNTKLGVRNIILTVCCLVTCGVTTVIAEVFGIIDGVKIFKSVINTDAQGRPLSSGGRGYFLFREKESNQRKSKAGLFVM